MGWLGGLRVVWPRALPRFRQKGLRRLRFLVRREIFSAVARARAERYVAQNLAVTGERIIEQQVLIRNLGRIQITFWMETTKIWLSANATFWRS